MLGSAYQVKQAEAEGHEGCDEHAAPEGDAGKVAVEHHRVELREKASKPAHRHDIHRNGAQRGGVVRTHTRVIHMRCNVCIEDSWSRSSHRGGTWEKVRPPSATPAEPGNAMSSVQLTCGRERNEGGLQRGVTKKGAHKATKR